MKKYKLLIDSPDFCKGLVVTEQALPKDHEWRYQSDTHGLFSREQIENRPEVWEQIDSEVDCCVDKVEVRSLEILKFLESIANDYDAEGSVMVGKTVRGLCERISKRFLRF